MARRSAEGHEGARIPNVHVPRGEVRSGKAPARERGDARAEDRYERKGLAFHMKLREGFLEILRRNPKRCRLIDAAQDVDAVTQDVWSILDGAL